MKEFQRVEPIPVEVRNDRGHFLRGDYFPVLGRRRVPVALIERGFPADGHEKVLFDEITHSLNASGLAVYRFDPTGVGNSDGDQSSMTLESLAEDLYTKWDFVRDQNTTDQDRMLILGHSLAGPLIAECGVESLATAYVAPFIDPYSALERMFVRGGNFNPEGTSSLKHKDGSVISLGPQFWKGLKSFDPEAVWMEAPGPKMVIYGTEDPLIRRFEYSGMIPVMREPVRSIEIEGGDDVFKGKEREVAGMVSNYFSRLVRYYSGKSERPL